MAGEIDATAIQAVWDMVPDVECDGSCANYCSAVPMTALELALVRGRMPWYPNFAEIQKRLVKGDRRCPALTAHGRCGVYDVRPTVCRLFGAADVDTIRCPYGCTPKLTATEATAVMNAAHEAGGATA